MPAAPGAPRALVLRRPAEQEVPSNVLPSGEQSDNFGCLRKSARVAQFQVAIVLHRAAVIRNTRSGRADNSEKRVASSMRTGVVERQWNGCHVQLAAKPRAG